MLTIYSDILSIGGFEVYLKIGIIFFSLSATMFFAIQLLTKIRSLLISSGVMAGDHDYTYLTTSLVWIPLILLIMSIFAIWYHFNKVQKP